MKSRIIGIENTMNEFDFLSGLLVSEVLFRNCDNLSKPLQSDTISASERQRIANITIEALISTRNESSFELLWEKVNILKEKYDINDAVLKRKRKPPSSLDDGKAQPEFPETPYAHYRSTYMKVLDNVINCITDRFNQPG